MIILYDNTNNRRSYILYIIYMYLTSSNEGKFHFKNIFYVFRNIKCSLMSFVHDILDDKRLHKEVNISRLY